MQQKKFTQKLQNTAARLKWSVEVPKVVNYLTKDEYTIVPRVVKMFGENFNIKDKRMYLFDREIVIDTKRRDQILNKTEEEYGGVKKAHFRLMRKYINISRRDIMEFFGGSERRQLKREFNKTKSSESFIHANRPGVIQIDLTFYRGAKIPVFVGIDVHSRYVYVQRVVSKVAKDVVSKALANCIDIMEKLSGYKVRKVSSDAGSEFAGDTTRLMKQMNIVYDRAARSRKIVERVNGTLRKYIERVQFDTHKELDQLFEKFTENYNQSVHNSTGKAPIDMMTETNKKVTRKDAEAAYKRGKKRIDKKGFNLPELKIGDMVRIYDPRRRGIKADMKKSLKGKVKLGPADFVKRFTSTHRGEAADWTKQIYIVWKIKTGRMTMYRLKGKDDLYIRPELQKVRKVTKKDPKVKERLEKQEAKAKRDAKIPQQNISERKTVGRFVYFKHNNKRTRGAILEVYNNFAIILHGDTISYRAKPDIDEFTRDTLAKYAKKASIYMPQHTYLKKLVKEAKDAHEADIIKTKDKIDKYLDS